MKRGVEITWAALLGVSYVVVVPTLVSLLRQSVDAARQIERYTAEILIHAQGIERNTAQAVALKETRALAPALLAASESLDEHSGAIQAALDRDGNEQQAGQEGEP